MSSFVSAQCRTLFLNLDNSIFRFDTLPTFSVNGQFISVPLGVIGHNNSGSHDSQFQVSGHIILNF